MRKLKIKVWDKVRQKIMEPQGITFEAKSLNPFAVKVSGRSWEPVGKYEIIEWTGLTDENREDVYEGDFIRISSQLYQVVWNEASAAFELVGMEDSKKRSIADAAEGYIAGNRFESTGNVHIAGGNS